MKFGISKGGDSKEFQTFTQGQYLCKFIKGKADLGHKNSYGDKPRHIFRLQPLKFNDKGDWVDTFYDTNFKEMKNFYVDKNKEEKPSYFRHNVNYKVEEDMSLSFSLFLGGDGMSPSKFGTMCKVLFGGSEREANCPYSAVEHFEGDEIVVNVTNSKDDKEREYANIVSFEKAEGYKPKTNAELEKIVISSKEEEEEKMKKFQASIKKDLEGDPAEISIDDIPALQ